VLQKLKRDAESYLGDRLTDAFITVRLLLDAERQAPKEAGRGRRPQRPARSSRAHRGALRTASDKGEKEQTILVFDLGGGTFDVSLARDR
jgi:molecular chaperone DnaK